MSAAAMSELSRTRVCGAVTLRDTISVLKARVPYTADDRALLADEVCLLPALRCRAALP